MNCKISFAMFFIVSSTVEMFYYLVYILIQVCSLQATLQGWDYINIHCRDNENKPLDWWYIFKPPPGAGENLELGRNFSYITPGLAGRWEPSDRFINSNSMLQHTLSPLYRPTYANNLAVISYCDRNDSTTQGSVGRGLMMADEVGGVWIGHTVPGLFDMNADRAMFPEAELGQGHLIMCMSLDLPTLIQLAATISETDPKVWHMKIPPSLRHLLPSFEYYKRRVMVQKKSPLPRPIEFQSTHKTLKATMLVRRPGEKRCLYRAFAKAKHIILDVYGHDKRMSHGCEKTFGIRRIESISLKYPESVYYIDNQTDRINFAVSTAAHWQRKDDGSPQYWACTSTVEGEDASEKGGLVVCVEHYNVWWSFDNMKLKEPKC